MLLFNISSESICCSINRDVINHNTILDLEEWENRGDLERHIQSPRYRELLEIIEQSMGTPEINFLTVSEIEGLEVVKKVRIKTNLQNINRGYLFQKLSEQ